MFQFYKQKPLGAPPTIIEYKNRLFHPRHAKGGLRIHGEFHHKAKPDKPLVTIITIVRNGVKTLEKTIQSVLNQTYDNIAYIIINGGSTDGTLDTIRKYEDKIAYWTSKPAAMNGATSDLKTAKWETRNIWMTDRPDLKGSMFSSTREQGWHYGTLSDTGSWKSSHTSI